MGGAPEDPSVLVEETVTTAVETYMTGTAGIRQDTEEMVLMASGLIGVGSEWMSMLELMCPIICRHISINSIDVSVFRRQKLGVVPVVNSIGSCKDTDRNVTNVIDATEQECIVNLRNGSPFTRIDPPFNKRSDQLECYPPPVPEPE